MLENIIPSFLWQIIKTKLDYEKLYEIRIRISSPITINLGGRYFFLTNNGASLSDENSIIADKDMVERVIFSASNHSIYAINNQLQHGFVTCEGGLRIGVCGDVVTENGNIITVKNFNSLNIRIPHQVKNCSLNAIKYLIDESGFKNTLIISPPGAGKTTFIRDVAFQLSNLNVGYNILILDERFEIASCADGVATHNVGKFSDVMSNCTKKYGFTEGIRSMRPDIIIADEIATEEDCGAIKFALNCGVKVIATTHASSINEYKNKVDFGELVKNLSFERYIVLSNENGPGTYEAIYDKKFNCLYCR